jgi:hypothetical protein
LAKIIPLKNCFILDHSGASSNGDEGEDEEDDEAEVDEEASEDEDGEDDADRVSAAGEEVEDLDRDAAGPGPSSALNGGGQEHLVKTQRKLDAAEVCFRKNS